MAATPTTATTKRSTWGPPQPANPKRTEGAPHLPSITEEPNVRKKWVLGQEVQPNPHPDYKPPKWEDPAESIAGINAAAQKTQKVLPIIPTEMEEILKNISNIIKIDTEIIALLVNKNVLQFKSIFDKYFKEYLDEVKIQSTTQFTEEQIKQKLIAAITTDNDFNTIFDEINARIEGLQRESQNFSCSLLEKKAWTMCIKDCNIVLNTHILKEVNSTAYKLRVLSSSLLSSQYQVQFKLRADILDINNLRLDSFEISLIKKSPTSPTLPTSPTSRRALPTLPSRTRTTPAPTPTDKHLIIGFGPKGTNKTKIVKELLPLLNISDIFMINESIFRNKSIFFKIIIFLLIIHNLSGIQNLKDIFNIKEVKKELLRYLGNTYNLYISESLETCENMSCELMIKGYAQKFNNTFIGLYLWQHKTQEECEYHGNLKCKGTYKNGKEIEIQNGEEFDNSNYDLSEQYGLELLAKATTALKIHVSGITNGIHLIEDHRSSLNLSGQTISKPLFKESLTSVGNFYYTKTPEQVKACELKKAKHHQRRCTTKSFADKYLKYKKKYLELKQQYNM
jgi:hypothetical protein